MNELKSVLRLKYKNQLSYREIETLKGISKSAMGNYVRAFEQSGLSIDEALAFTNDVLEARLFPETISAARLKSARPLPDFATIHQELKKKGVTRELLWQEYKERYPDGYGITQFKTYYNRYVQSISPSMRQIHYAGDKLFVDFSGLTLPFVDSFTGEVKKAQIFVAVLGASGYTFVHACESQNSEDFVECHNAAFSFFGGVPNSVVPDNLKAAVLLNRQGRLILNSGYADMASHYGVAVQPARPHKPQDKPKVEAGVKGIQRWILAKLRHHTFFSVDEINEALSPLLDAYNQKAIKRLGKSREELFVEIDEEALHPLPANRYVYREHKRCTVGIDYHVELFGCAYSVPYAHVGKKVDVWHSRTQVSIAYQGETLAIHPKIHRPGDASTHIEHMPKEHQYQYEKWNPGRILSWAQSMGGSTTQLMQTIMEERNHPVRGYRSCIAILNLSKTYGKEALEMASAKALEINARRVASIESMLKHKTYLDREENGINNLFFNAHANVRGADYYKGGRS